MSMAPALLCPVLRYPIGSDQPPCGGADKPSGKRPRYGPEVRCCSKPTNIDCRLCDFRLILRQNKPRRPIPAFQNGIYSCRSVCWSGWRGLAAEEELFHEWSLQICSVLVCASDPSLHLGSANILGKQPSWSNYPGRCLCRLSCFRQPMSAALPLL